MAAELRILPASSLAESPTNPRRTFSESALAELAASIGRQGILQPLVVRPSGAGTYEIVCGARRFRASQIAGLAELPCLVREFDDDQVLDAQLVENLQRQDVHPLEEGECIAQLLASKLYNGDSAAVAERISRPVSFVVRRASLNKLIDPLKNRLTEGTITIGFAERAAQCPKDQQESFEAKLSHQWNPWSGTESEIRSYLATQTIPLKNDRWKLSDAKLYPEAGACTACPHNSANGLFGDESPSCSNRTCFDRKTELYFARLAEKAKRKYPEAELLCGFGSRPSSEGLQYYTQWRHPRHNETEPTHKGIVINGPDAGSVIDFVRVTPSDPEAEAISEAERKAWRKTEIKSIRIESEYRYRLWEAILGELGKESTDIPLAEGHLFTLALIQLIHEASFPNSCRAHRNVPNEILTRPNPKDFRANLIRAVRNAASYEVAYHDHSRHGAPVLEAFARWLRVDTGLIRQEAETALMTAKERKAAGL